MKKCDILHLLLQVAAGTQSVVAITKDRDAAVGQVELLRAKLDQANSKNDVLRENYEMLDTKLTQVRGRGLGLGLT